MFCAAKRRFYFSSRIIKNVVVFLKQFISHATDFANEKMRKYIATAIALLMLLSVLPLSAYAATTPSGILVGAEVGTHGPYLNEIDFTVISTDSTLYSSLSTGTIQGPEEALSTGSFFSAAANSNLYTNSTALAGFDFFSFNSLRPITNSTHFRRAIQYLTDYSFIQGTVCGGVACVGTPELEYSGLYASSSNPSAYSWMKFSLTDAVAQLKLSGLTEGNTTDVALSKITWLYQGVQWIPTMYYRIDDPLRTGAAERLVYEASLIGLQFNAKGSTSTVTSAAVYGSTVLGVIHPGVYNPATGYNTPPVFNYTVAKNGQPDSWDMYTAVWLGLGSAFSYDYSFMNSANCGTQDFTNYYNATMDYYTNQVEYATSVTAAAHAAQEAEVVFAQNNPYVIMFWNSQLYSVYLNGWTGYVAWPGSGPMTFPGAYWTFLNVHPSNQPTGGKFVFALHEIPDGGFGFNPLYVTNWNWQIDIWNEIYGTALNQNPAQPTTSLAYIGWTGPYNVSSFTGNTGSGAGWFEFQTTQSSQKIHQGTVITLNFDKNITFSDNVPFTAYDYNFSLYVFNVAGSLKDNDNPWGHGLAGSKGLIATHISPNDPYQIELYVNSSSIWNIMQIQRVTIFPLHIWKYFNPDAVSTATKALDITLPYDKAAAACSCSANGVTSAPTWLRDLPNLGVSNGPFKLTFYDPATGSGILVKNLNYYRAAWWAGAPTVTTGSAFTFSTNINESIYNSGSAALGGVAAGSTGTVPITNATGTVTLLLNDQQVGSPVALTAGSSGKYTASIPTSSLSAGTYELVVNATYNFLGLPRVWYQAAGLVVTASGTTTTQTTAHTTTTPTTTQTTTTQTTSTTTTTDYTPYIYGGIIVVIIIILIAVVLARRHSGGGT